MPAVVARHVCRVEFCAVPSLPCLFQSYNAVPSESIEAINNLHGLYRSNPNAVGVNNDCEL